MKGVVVFGLTRDPRMKQMFEFSRVITLALLILWPLSSSGSTSKITVVDGQFHTPSGAIPAGCLVQMKSLMNGDEMVASVILEVEGKLGCMNAKHPYPEQLQVPEAGGRCQLTAECPKLDPPSYSIEAKLPGQVYQINACEGLKGSSGKGCSKILIQFSERTFGGKTALVVNHRGRGSALKSFDAKARVAEIRERYRAVAGNEKLKKKVLKSDCTNPGLTGEEPFGGRETLYRMMNGQVAEIKDTLSTMYGFEAVQFLLKDGEIWFAFLQVRNESIPAMGIEFGYDTDIRLYFDKQRPFLCKLTYQKEAPEGIQTDKNLEIPCADIFQTQSPHEEKRVAEPTTLADDVEGLLAYGKKVLEMASAKTQTGHDDWCKEGGGL